MSDFLDLATMARKLGVTDAVLRAKVLELELTPYAYVSNEQLEGGDEDFLPAWSRNRFPYVRWADHGSAIEGYSKIHGCPRYVLSGWVVLSEDTVGVLLANKRDVNLHNEWVGIEDSQGDIVSLRVLGRQVWIPDEEGGYHDLRATQLSASDIYLLPDNQKTATDVDPRRERSLLRIIRALDVMAHLPSRGAATAIERQLQELGFSGPNDETVRGILSEARALDSDAKA